MLILNSYTYNEIMKLSSAVDAFVGNTYQSRNKKPAAVPEA